MIKATLPAYIPDYYLQRLLSVTEDQEKIDELISMMEINSNEWIKEDGTYIPVGTAEVTFYPLPQADMQKGQVSALEAQIEKIRAEASVKVMKIQEQIANIQALEYSK